MAAQQPCWIFLESHANEHDVGSVSLAATELELLEGRLRTWP